MLTHFTNCPIYHLFSSSLSGDSELARIIIDESNAEGEEARKFLEDVQVTFPQVCAYDSMVHCFFIEAEKIEELRQSDPSVEVFLWQESALVITRLLLPQIFEKMAMHEIRVLVAERSTMNIYIKGKDIELEQNCIGNLLEGSLETKNQNLIMSPGVLLPSNTDLSLIGLDYSAVNHIDCCYTAPSYQVEARARIIFFKIGRVSDQGHDLPRTKSKEHSGLLSWPENFRRSRGPHSGSLAEIRNQPSSFSARALQLSMYGSMVSLSSGQGHRRQCHHPVRATNQKPSSSYPELALRPSNTRPLLSVQSEV
ncbi:Sodium/hydrogen exchanger 7 [Dichanthelium oligosanthes]|uniref:Sodium/hydrogen exchanger 7 n=1 Tax=Dichanthelium oligosanthes TaxID=888268 RepID=A0A1E5VLX2_9POAL|nr:Sodium/hydrogen exchanger 7 [Dichanthelium oligosanthes]